MDLEELPDLRERTGAPVLWLSCEGQANVWEMFSDNSYLNAFLDRQGLLVAAPVDLRTKKAENSTPQLHAQDTESDEKYDCVSYAVNRFLEPFTECASVSGDKEGYYT